MKLLVLGISVLLTAVTTSQATNCTAEFCNVIDCMRLERSQCKGVFIVNGGVCGCCNACYEAIEPGQPCQRLDLSSPPTAVCKSGYFCDNGICRPYLG
ncbi:unnamed protein product [Candidula unifasciata]|uniref:Uncharacterized protein n=1 Tax=Candidula unifasciata TaxID=100452 RepID=A0A8S3Z5P5_9EUPU|nr:unnamed protein product [Candidula unifasciata]